MQKILLSCFFSILFLGKFCAAAMAQTAESRFVPLPITSQKTTLRVLVANNDRLPVLDPIKVKKILLSAQKMSKSDLGLDVVFEDPKFADLKDVKLLIRPQDIESIKRLSLDLSITSNVDSLKQAMRRDLRLSGEALVDIQNYASPFLLKQPSDKTEAAFADALADTQAIIISKWRSLKLQDGQPLLGNDLFNEYSFWRALGYTRLPFEVVLTNQLIASAETYGNSVHSALRGGVSNGITGSSHLSKNGVFSVLSTYPFYSSDATTLGLRGGKKYGEEDASQYAASLLTHELGHQLLHLGHPFNNPSCIMRPPQRLDFESWYKNLNAESCKLNSTDAMTPGKTVRHSDIRDK